MNDELTKVKIKFITSYDKSNRNGTVYTKEAIRNAMESFNRQLPITIRSKEEYSYPIGVTDGTYHCTWNDSTKAVETVIDGCIFNVDADIVVNQMNGSEVTDFRIRALSVLK